MSETAVMAGVGDRLGPGTRIEIRSSFDAKWKRGFEVLDVADDGYRIRRLSDGSELPGTFPFGVVRRQRDDGMWWWH